MERVKTSPWGLFSRKTVQEPVVPAADASVVAKSYGFEGVTFSVPVELGTDWLRRPLEFVGQESMVAFLGQVEEEGYATWNDKDLILSWESVYRLAVSDEYRSGLTLTEMPAILPWRPRLESQGGLGDQDFAVLLAGWIGPSGQTIHGDLSLRGAVASWRGEESLLTRAAWNTVNEIALFHRRPVAQRDADSNRRGWANIRNHAVAAKADLSNFLRLTVVLTPEKLRLNLRKGGGDESKLVEVIPDFENAPPKWIGAFDRSDSVLGRYDIPDGEGITQVILTPEIRSVLREIKRMPGRRAVGLRAEAFVRNPFAMLGPDAAKVIDPEEFDAKREEAGISFARFTPELIRDSQGFLTDVALKIEETIGGTVKENQLRLGTADELEKFVSKLSDRISQEAHCCFWDGYDLEILGETNDHLEALRKALSEWKAPDTFGLADILDLSFYSERIEGFGVEKPYFSPFIAKREHKSEWFPEDISYGVTYDPEDGTEPVAITLDGETIVAFEERLESAKSEKAESFSFPGFPRPIPVKEADRIISSFKSAQDDVEKKKLDPQNLKPIKHARVRKQLIVRSNVDSIDYEERRGALSPLEETEPKLPSTLKPEFPLKPHQLDGLKWLQHLWAHSPADCRGALLADDMGLGKTIQLLAFIATCLEENPQADPFLIVAPVSLLENWKDEIDKFFEADTLPVLALYGSVLASRRLSRESIEAEVTDAGIGRLLIRNWVGKAKIVLTTYDTLRDLEFSLGRQKWSAMICDEAQKIKNPNALVSRAAKKQNARFKIACTGTPVENTLTDLWCLFDFIQPGLLGALASFGHKYKRPIEAETADEKARIEELRALIEPQKLRRMKAEVAKDLPAKIEPRECRNLPISAHQRALYSKAIYDFRHKSSMGKREGLEGPLGLLQYLRALCTDPRPSSGHSADYESLVELESHSPKLAWLLAELPKIRARQEKVIIFCEFRHLQRTLQRAIGERFDLIPDIINGQTSAAAEYSNNRQQRINAFQNKPGFGVIILSPLAVGFGLNIQAANHVIHFTRTWNPAKEDQATDRAYRIGQTKDVYVYYPVITATDFETFDARLDELLEWKRELSRDMLNGSGDLGLNDFAKLQDVGESGAFS